MEVEALSIAERCSRSRRGGLVPEVLSGRWCCGRNPRSGLDHIVVVDLPPYEDKHALVIGKNHRSRLNIIRSSDLREAQLQCLILRMEGCTPRCSPELEAKVAALFRGGKICLAPMVRAGTVPFRMLSVNHGADAVWTEEIIDKKLMDCKRVVNDTIGTVDFLTNKGNQLVLRIAPQERDRVIVQLGSCTPESAVAAASVVANDVSGIDINMGCPKHFSVQGGMGAALLQEPEKAASIISALRQALSIPVTCKIRLLETPERTLAFVRAMEAAGACAISVHMRTRDDKPQSRANWEALAPIVRAVSIPVLANGDLYTREAIEEIQRMSGCDGVILARPALYNVCLFRKEGNMERPEEMIRAYLMECLRWDNNIHNSKYTVMEMMSKRRHPDHLKDKLPICLPPDKTIKLMAECKTMEALMKAWDMQQQWDQHLQNQALRKEEKHEPLEHVQRYADDYVLREEEAQQGIKRKLEAAGNGTHATEGADATQDSEA